MLINVALDLNNLDGCAVVRCPSNTYCQISNRTGNALCVPDCQINNGGCREDQVCEVVVSNGCVSSDSCDPLMFALCKDPLFGKSFEIEL